LDYLLFGVYLLLFSWLILRLRFFKNSTPGSKTAVGLFLIKVIAGCVFGWIYHKYYMPADTWLFHNGGVKEYELLFNNPKEYLTNLFENSYQGGLTRVIDSTSSFWNDFRTNFLVKILSIFNIFSFGNYYINIIFFNFLTLIGGTCIYRVYAQIFTNHRWLLLIGVFLYPSFLFYTSGIHRDGFILLGLGLIIYNTFYAIRIDRFSFKRIAGVIAGCIILFLFRNFVLICFLPALFAWLLSERNKRRPLATFAAVYGCGIILFFTLGKIHPRLDFPKYVSDRQKEFSYLSVNSSAIHLNTLEPNIWSFAYNAPQAFNHAFMRPYITEVKKPQQVFVALEILGFLLLIVFFILFRRKDLPLDTFVVFGVLFSLTMLLLIGYTIANIGALTRYRSVYFPFLVVPLICYTNWQTILSRFNIIKK
jgi:hypothetical protein